MKPLFCLASCLLLAACASRQAVVSLDSAAEPPAPMQQQQWSRQWLMQAVTAPLSDLNLVKVQIPPVLLAAQQAPYAMPETQDCTVLQREVDELDIVLGADLDIPSTPENPGLIARSSSEVSSAAARALQDASTDIIPYRSWLRRLSGAERYSRDVEAAIAAGTVRRAFLKGLLRARNGACPQ